jgi:LytR cell envelope-related transcriptional attenuator
LLEIVQEIGAVAGWAAVVGLAVLLALYFSQARDVKRLREWAGRAPERAATPAGASGPPPVAPQPVRRTPSPQRPITRPAASCAVPQQTVISPPRRSQPWYSRIGTRYLAVALVGLLVVGGAAAYGVTQLTGDDGGDDSGNAQTNKSKRNGAAVKPGNVTVAVLNGTTVPGLAAALRDQIAAAGFKKGTINVFSDQQLAESVVEYAPGRQAAAKAVSRRLGISQLEPVTSNSRALAGAATVIVIAGADKAP